MLPPRLQQPHHINYLPPNAHYNITGHRLLALLRRASCNPDNEIRYAQLYLDNNYTQKSLRKVKKMKNVLNLRNVDTAIRSSRFWRQVSRVEYTYPAKGNRDFLYLLVGKHFYFLKYIANKKKKNFPLKKDQHNCLSKLSALTLL